MRAPISFLAAILLCLGCAPNVRISSETDALPDIFPDYADVTVPVNIAPLNFRYQGTETSALILGAGEVQCTLKGPVFDIPVDKWQALTAAGDIPARVCVKEKQRLLRL